MDGGHHPDVKRPRRTNAAGLGVECFVLAEPRWFLGAGQPQVMDRDLTVGAGHLGQMPAAWTRYLRCVSMSERAGFGEQRHATGLGRWWLRS
jgi:hypothetical protein